MPALAAAGAGAGGVRFCGVRRRRQRPRRTASGNPPPPLTSAVLPPPPLPPPSCAEVEATLRKIADGVEEWDELWDKLEETEVGW